MEPTADAGERIRIGTAQIVRLALSLKVTNVWKRPCNAKKMALINLDKSVEHVYREGGATTEPAANAATLTW